jgi:hypothetical protein
MAEQVERLSYHALRGEVWDKALAYCRQAGEKAMVWSAYHLQPGRNATPLPRGWSVWSLMHRMAWISLKRRPSAPDITRALATVLSIS